MIITVGCSKEDDGVEAETEGNVTSNEEALPTAEELSDNLESSSSNGSMLADELAITQAIIAKVTETNELVMEADVQTQEGNVNFTITVPDGSQAEDIQSAAEEFLWNLSNKTVGSNPTEDTYGKLFDEYGAIIIVQDESGNDVARGSMEKGSHTINW